MKYNAAPLFSMGNVYFTPGVMNTISQEEANTFLYRHSHGNWGIISAEDAEENWFSLQNGYRLLSAYCTYDGVTVWVITEADRSCTTILLPEEY